MKVWYIRSSRRSAKMQWHMLYGYSITVRNADGSYTAEACHFFTKKKYAVEHLKRIQPEGDALFINSVSL